MTWGVVRASHRLEHELAVTGLFGDHSLGALVEPNGVGAVLGLGELAQLGVPLLGEVRLRRRDPLPAERIDLTRASSRHARELQVARERRRSEVIRDLQHGLQLALARWPAVLVSLRLGDLQVSERVDREQPSAPDAPGIVEHRSQRRDRAVAPATRQPLRHDLIAIGSAAGRSLIELAHRQVPVLGDEAARALLVVDHR